MWRGFCEQKYHTDSRAFANLLASYTLSGMDIQSTFARRFSSLRSMTHFCIELVREKISQDVLNKDGNISDLNQNQFQCQLKVMGRIPSVQNSNSRLFEEAEI